MRRPPFQPRIWLASLALLLPLLAACEPPATPPQPAALSAAAPAASQPPATQPAAAKPWLLHIPGVSGESIVDHTLVHGLVDGNLQADIQIYDWTEHDPGVPALQARERNKKEAAKIAGILADHFRADPRRTIYLVGHSGGAGLAAWALEDLPPDVMVTRAIFLAPALSPTYDLSRALAHVRDKAYVFCNKDDLVVLRAGTKLFGTIDGVYVEAAGVAGFKRPDDAADPTQYKKLLQIPYRGDWARLGNFGDHIGVMSTPFAAEVLVPLLEGKSPAWLAATATAATAPASATQPAAGAHR